MGEKIKQGLSEVGLAIKDAGNEAIQQEISAIREDARAEALNEGIKKFTEALIEIKVSDNEIERLLWKYWQLPPEEATSALCHYKAEFKKDEFTHYLKQCGYSEKQVSEYMKKHMVGPKLRHENNLLNLTLVKLKEYFDKE